MRGGNMVGSLVAFFFSFSFFFFSLLDFLFSPRPSLYSPDLLFCFPYPLPPYPKNIKFGAHVGAPERRCLLHTYVCTYTLRRGTIITAGPQPTYVVRARL